MDGDNDPLDLHNSDAPADRFRKIREELEAMKLPDLDAEALGTTLHEKAERPRLPDLPDLDPITSKAWETKSRYDAAKKEQKQRHRVENDSTQSLGVGINLVYMIIGPPLVGFGLGFLVDLWLKTPYFRAVGALIGATAGVWAAIVTLNHVSKNQ